METANGRILCELAMALASKIVCGGRHPSIVSPLCATLLSYVDLGQFLVLGAGSFLLGNALPLVPINLHYMIINFNTKFNI